VPGSGFACERLRARCRIAALSSKVSRPQITVQQAIVVRVAADQPRKRHSSTRGKRPNEA
jgi:hypothetical protein